MMVEYIHDKYGDYPADWMEPVSIGAFLFVMRAILDAIISL
jgi:hypothetical protein